MSDAFLDTPVGSMNFNPGRPRPKDGPAGTKPTPTTTAPRGSLSFAPSYQDYLSANPQNNGGSEGGGGFSGLSEEQWNALAPDQRWNNIGSGMALGPNDPRYAAIAQQLGITDGSVIRLGDTSQSNPINSTYYNDPNAVVQGDGVFATGQQNLTPFSEISRGVPDWYWPVGFALGVAGGALGADAGIFTGTAPTVGEAGMAGGITGGADIAGAAGAAGAAGTVGASGAETVPEILGPDGTMLPPGAESIPPPVDVPPPVGAPPEATPGLQVPPPMEPITAPTLDPMVPPYDPSAVADGLTPTINDAIVPPAGAPSGSGPGLPTTPDFNIPDFNPPNVDVPSPDINIANPPWWQAPLDSITSHPLQAAGLGLTAFNALHRPPQPNINSNVPETNKPVVDAAVQDILHKGALSPDQRHSIDGIIDQHIHEGVEAINQRAINSGMGANSMVTQEQINQFKQNAEVARAQLYQQQMQQNISNAIQVWAEGNREDIAIQTAAANLAMQNNQEISRINQSVSQSLGWLYSMSNSRSAPSTFPGG